MCFGGCFQASCASHRVARQDMTCSSSRRNPYLSFPMLVPGSWWAYSSHRKARKSRKRQSKSLPFLKGLFFCLFFPPSTTNLTFPRSSQTLLLVADQPSMHVPTSQERGFQAGHWWRSPPLCHSMCSHLISGTATNVSPPSLMSYALLCPWCSSMVINLECSLWWHLRG